MLQKGKRALYTHHACTAAGLNLLTGLNVFHMCDNHIETQNEYEITEGVSFCVQKAEDVAIQKGWG